MKICFVAHNAYAALTDQRLGHVGGIERQQAMMATWLAERGHEVSMITWRQPGAHEEKPGLVQVHFVCGTNDGLPVVRFVHPRWTSLVKALSAADADVYYCNLGDVVLGQVVSWAKLRGKATIYSVSSEPLCQQDLSDILPLRERVLYRYGLRHVRKIITQTNTQAALLRKEYGRDAEVLPMPCRDLSAQHSLASPPTPSLPPRVLWVGRFSAEKRPALLLALAARCPDVRFDVVGQANQQTDYARTFISQARHLSNVTLHGVVQHRDIGAYYREAKAILCTSLFEGFPNVFLEAWSTGVPIVTTFDPDAVVSREGLGFVSASGSVDELQAALQSLLADPVVWKRCSDSARRYFVGNHQIERAMPRFEQALQCSR